MAIADVSVVFVVVVVVAVDVVVVLIIALVESLIFIESFTTLLAILVLQARCKSTRLQMQFQQ